MCKTPDGVALFVVPDDPLLAQGQSAIRLPSPVKPDPALVQNIVQAIDESLVLLSEKGSDTDTQYYEDGIWHFPNTSSGMWLYGAGPAGMAAALWDWRQHHLDSLDAATKARQDWLHKIAVETFDRALKDHQKPDGDFADLTGHRVFFTIDFVNTYLLLKDTLDADTRQRWLAAMAIQVQFLMQHGELPNPALGNNWKGTDGWYVNGNVELCQAEWLYLVWKATGEQKYKDLYERQWKKTVRPSPRWKGYGVFYFKQPTRSDGADGSAFLAEANVVPGFDPEYGTLQLSAAARLYMKSRDPRALRLTNLLLNSLLPSLNKDTMVLDATYGSRHSTYPLFQVCAPEVLAWLGGRSDLLPMLSDQFNKGVKAPLLQNARTNQGAPGIYRAYGFDFAAMLETISVTER